jgi:aldose sugar dehydrogenase
MKRIGAPLAALTVALAVNLSAWAQPPKAQDFPPPKPAFPEQTKAAPPAKASPALNVEVLVRGLSRPWSFAFLPDGRFLVAERNGALRIANRDGIYSAPIAGVPDVKVVAAQGLHDVVLDPHFAQNRFIYLTYFAPPPGEEPAVWPNDYFYDRVTKLPLAERRRTSIGSERVARARLAEDGKHLENVTVLLEGAERRIVFAPDGTMFVTGADRFRFYDSDMDGVEHEIDDLNVLRNFTGRVVRINSDGSIPKDNPFLAQPTVLPETYSYGHRDPEGAAIHPTTGELWLVEHGPLGGDELNVIRPGRDYGWPNVSYGRQYSGVPVGKGATARDGTEQPVYFWYPDIAPSSMLFYTGNAFPDWKGDVLVGSMGAKELRRLVIRGERVIAEERLLTDLGQRVRDLHQGTDGAVYLLTDEGNLVRLTPRASASK